jgi:tetratricopeptide (TPR) repeat protein
MKKLLLSLCIIAAMSASAQQLTSIVPGGDRKAMIGEQIGLTKVMINYDRPGVKGREGKIWGQLVPVGFTDLGFGSSKAAPWRAGANENTTIEFSTDVKIEGKPLPAGKYAFFVAWDPNECTLIFSKNSGSWGSFYYKESEDALRVKVKPQPTDKSVEWLKYEFINQAANSATVALQWEKMMIPFKVEVDLVQTQLSSYRQELQTRKGFQWQPWVEAAMYAVQNNTNLEEALLWADTATSPIFGGSTQFQAWSAKAQVLQKLGRGNEAQEIMKKYLPLASMQEVHQYGRQLLQLGKKKEALDVFKSNNAKYPNEFTTLFGLARGYSANADYPNALKYAKLALAVVPNAGNRTVVETAIKKLEEGKDFN